MMRYSFQLSCESTVDMPYSYISGRDISVLFYTYSIDGKEYVDNMGRDEAVMDDFFTQLKSGKMPITSQINAFRYEEYFEELLQKGDVLHVAFGTGMTPSYHNAVEAAKLLREKYPERKLVVVDSLCSCGGYGILVDSAADLRDEGKTIEEVAQWLLDNRNKVVHQIFCTDLAQFKRSGRVSGPVALVGSLLGICPVMNLNAEGRIFAYGKIRGKKNAIRTCVDEVMKTIQNGTDYDGKLYICHSNCPELQQEVVEAVRERFPGREIAIQEGRIGAVISAHCGASTVAIFCFGGDRTK